MFPILTLLLAFGTSASIVPRSCSFTLTASGGDPGTVGRLDDGQLRIGGGLAPTTFSLADTGSITDSAGFGCILTESIEQFQCDQFATGQLGFSIGSNGAFAYKGNTTFYACPASETESNIYVIPVAGQKKCVEIQLTASGCGATSTSSAHSAPAPTNVTCTAPKVQMSTVTSISVSTVTSVSLSTVTSISVSTITSVSVSVSVSTLTVQKCSATSPAAVSSPAIISKITVAPAKSAPQETTPAAVNTPVQSSPTGKSTPIKTTPQIESTPVKTTQVLESTPAKSAPQNSKVESSLVKSSPAVESTPLKSTQLQSPPAQNTPVKSTPSQSSPAQSTPAKSMPAVGTTTKSTVPVLSTTSKLQVPVPSSKASTATTSYSKAESTTSAPKESMAASSSKPKMSMSSSATMVTKPSTAQTASTTAATSSGCGGILSGSPTSGNYATPALIVPVNSASPNKAYGTQYFATISNTTSTLFNFNIPSSWSGSTCSLYFLFPLKSQLETSDYTFTPATGKSNGVIDVLKLSEAATEETTYSTVPSGTDVATINITPGSNNLITTFACSGGTTVAYEMVSEYNTYLYYFQDYNPCPLGLFITHS